MKKLLALLSLVLLVGSVQAQNTPQPTTTIASRFREYIYANLPTNPRSGTRVTVTDCATAACTTGGGSIRADLRWTGSAWETVAGGSGGVGSATDGQVLVNTSGSVAGKDIEGVGSKIVAATCTTADGRVLVWDAGDNRFECGDPSIIDRADDDGTVVLASTDRGRVVNSGHATANAVSIAQAGTAGFEDGYFTRHCTTGAGRTTITPTTSTINGAATLIVERPSSTVYGCVEIRSDGTNYIGTFYDIQTFTGNCSTDGNCDTEAPTGNLVTDDVSTTTETAFALSYPVPANYLVANKAIRITWVIETDLGGSPPTCSFGVRWGGVGGTPVYTSGAVTLGVASAVRGFSMSFLIVGTATPDGTDPIIVSLVNWPNVAAGSLGNTTAQPVTVAANAANTVVLTADWTSNAANTHKIRARAILIERVN